MIDVNRGPEPPLLAPIRIRELQRVGAIAALRQPTGDEIGSAYKATSEHLWISQNYKCCFCEMLIQRSFNDVEHFRPKAEANREPGSVHTHGYWWLAWTWDNLLYSCPSCNRSYKGTRFPLDFGSVTLAPNQQPPGQERPLLIDPAEEDPAEHIQFRFETLPNTSRSRWIPRPRRGSIKGYHTIFVAGLDRSELLDHYDRHVNDYVIHEKNAIEASAQSGNIQELTRAWKHAMALMGPRRPHSALSYDALDHFFPIAFRQHRAL